MMSKPIDNQCKCTNLISTGNSSNSSLVLNKLVLCFEVLRRPIHGAASGEGSDSEEELAAFCPAVSLSQKLCEVHLTENFPKCKISFH